MPAEPTFITDFEKAAQPTTHQELFSTLHEIRMAIYAMHHAISELNAADDPLVKAHLEAARRHLVQLDGHLKPLVFKAGTYG